MASSLVDTNQHKTAAELAVMVRKKLRSQDMDGIVTVSPSPIYGWEARVTATPGQMVAPFATVERIAAELRERYSLKSRPVSSIKQMFAEDGGAGRSAVFILQAGRSAFRCSQLACTELEGRRASP
jgi:hypothetical protein